MAGMKGYRTATVVLATITVGLGILLGLLFVGAGAGRLYLARGGGRR
jgi:hypothetical protein